MRIAATTVIRHVPATDCSGRLLTIELDPDLDRVTIVADHRLPENRFRSVDPNRRDGTRSLRPTPVDPDLLVDFRDPSVLVEHTHDVAHMNALVVDGDSLVVS